MFGVSITTHLTIQSATGRLLGARVVELLTLVDQHGSLAAACAASNTSYRHAWQLLREGEALFGQPLLVMARGKGSDLTLLGERLVWAQRRIQARLSPLLESLASELGAELGNLVALAPGQLRIHASHGFSVQTLHAFLAREGIAHELKYCSSAEALEALGTGQCDVAGFHLPTGALEASAVAHYRHALDPARYRAIRLATRRQGLMTRPGNPGRIYGIADLTRPDVRFVNRQPGSGTRLLFDLMLGQEGVRPSAIHGYEQCEFTHAAVAACVASGMADAGMGVEPPARGFKLEFIPLALERYMLLCPADRVDSPVVRPLLEVLRSEAFQRAVDALPGYATDQTGSVQVLSELVPTLAPPAARGRKSSPRRAVGA